MPDISNADLVGLAGTFLASFVAAIGMRKGGHERDSLPAPNESMSAGVFVGMDAQTERSILEELRKLHENMISWRTEDREERHAAEVQDLKEEIADLKRGQGQTHAGQRDIAAMIAELLSQPGVTEERDRIRHARSPKPPSQE